MDTLRVIQPTDDIRPGDLVECIEARSHAHYLRTGGRYVVEHVQRAADGRLMLFFRAGPAIGWPCQQFRLLRGRASAAHPE